MTKVFRDRSDAGRQLAKVLAGLAAENPIVLGLPRGGVPVAFEVARELHAPLDVIVVRKLGAPFHPELGMGAVGEDGARVLNGRVIRLAGVTPQEIGRIEAHERSEVQARARRFRLGRPMLPLAGRTVVVVDDGIATGGTARAALQVARAHGAGRVVLAVPVAPPDTIAELRQDADEVVVLETPTMLSAVGQWYADFSEVPDARVVELLASAEARQDADLDGGAIIDRSERSDREIELHLGEVVIRGNLTVPAESVGVVLFAHGSGSSRHSPRNRFVARALNQVHLATLVLDLLTSAEELDRSNVFDVELLARRLVSATKAMGRALPNLPVGYFGASTGAASALLAAAELPGVIAAVVSRGGRPDLAAARLREVRAPTLLVVGGNDEVVLGLNRDAARQMTCEHRLTIVPGATHLFEEPGTLDQVARLAADWFLQHFPAGER